MLFLSACATRGPKPLVDSRTGIAVSKPQGWLRLTPEEKKRAPIFLLAKYKEPVPQFNPSASLVWIDLPAPVTRDPLLILSRLEAQVAPTLKNYKRVGLGLIGPPPNSILDSWRARLDGRFVFENPSGKPSEDASYRLEVIRGLRGLAVLSMSGPLTGPDESSLIFDGIAASFVLRERPTNDFDRAALKLDERIIGDKTIQSKAQQLSPQDLHRYLRWLAARGFWRMRDEDLVVLNQIRHQVLKQMSDSDCRAFASGALSESRFGELFLKAVVKEDMDRHFDLNWEALQLGLKAGELNPPQPLEILSALRRLAEVVPAQERSQLMDIFNPKSDSDSRGQKGCSLLKSLGEHGPLLLSADIALLVRSFLHPEALQSFP